MNLPEPEVSAAFRRIQSRTYELIARGWHGPYYSRSDLYDLALDRWVARQAAKGKAHD